MALSQTTGAFADDCAPKPVCPPKPCPPKPCCKPVCCSPMPEDCCERNICTPTGMITPRVDRITGNAMDWVISADYTYWTARERGLEYAVSVASQGANPTEGTDQGQIYRPGNKWASGFKVGLGTDFCHDGWDLYAEYTWFKKTDNSNTPDDFSTANPTPDGVLGLKDAFWNVNGAGSNGGPAAPVYSGASAQWRLNMNVVDLELGRNFYVSPRLMLRPFYGLKGAWNKQHMDVSFTGISTNVPATAGIVHSMTNKIKNWGIGVRAGMDTSWHFSRSFSIIGDMAFTGLWEEFKMTRFDTEESLGTLTGSNVNIKENQYTVEPVIEWMLGLKWETGFSCDAYHLAITAAWEEQVWFEQNNFLRIPGTASATGNSLSLQGLTLDVRFDF